MPKFTIPPKENPTVQAIVSVIVLLLVVAILAVIGKILIATIIFLLGVVFGIGLHSSNPLDKDKE